MHSGNSLMGLPIYAPADDAIPAPAVPAPRAFVRPFVSDHALLQREARTNDAAITTGAYGIIGFCTLLLLAMLAWGLHRIRVTATPGDYRTRLRVQPLVHARHAPRGLRGSSTWLTRSKSCPTTTAPPATDPGAQHVRIAIVGSGFAGIGMAIRLKQAGIEDFVVLERADDVGGTWQANTYPGCQCDVPSHLYSFSFEPNPSWTRTYSRQPEIWAVPARLRRALRAERAPAPAVTS